MGVAAVPGGAQPLVKHLHLRQHVQLVDARRRRDLLVQQDDAQGALARRHASAVADSTMLRMSST